MKATIEIQLKIYVRCPVEQKLYDAVWKLVADSGYTGSEEIDGTDEWGLEVGEINIKIQREHGKEPK